MSKIAVMSIAAVALTSPASAQQPPRTETVFSCTLRGGNLVTITARGDRLTYRYGKSRRPQLTLSGGPETGNVFLLQQRYAGPQRQLRFVNGDYSYIVHYMGADPRVANSFSGLVVMRGTRRVSDRLCTRYREFEAGWDLIHRLPEDSEAWSVM